MRHSAAIPLPSRTDLVRKQLIPRLTAWAGEFACSSSKFPARGERVGLSFSRDDLAVALSRPAAAETIPEPVALLQGLDKITARVSKFEAPVGTPVRFGTLSIRVRDCEKNPPEETPESAAFLEIDEVRPGEEIARVQRLDVCVEPGTVGARASGL